MQATELTDGGIKMLKAKARIQKHGQGQTIIVDNCPYCHQLHYHGVGNLSSIISSRVAECGGGHYELDFIREELYYIQDKARGYTGLSIVWWKEGGSGYACDVRKAKVWTKTEMERLREGDGDLRAWPKEYIDERIEHHIDMQYCDPTFDRVLNYYA